MNIEVVHGQQCHEDDVSDVYQDSLRMLVEGVGSILDGRDQVEIPWFLEPDVMRWTLLREGENVLAIQVHNMHDNGNPSSDMSAIPFLSVGLTTSAKNRQ